MEKQLYIRTALQMIELVRCALNGTAPSAEQTAELDLDALFEVSESHSLTACTAYALEAAGIRNPRFAEAKNKAIRKNILLDAERAKILAALEEKQIWHMPLKGAILKDWYPQIGMRQMSDNDILFDPERAEDVRDVMTAAGFQTERFGKYAHDVYFKEPVMNFEMHRSLFSKESGAQYFAYYQNISEKLIPDAGSAFGRHFSDEDFYLYFLAHEHKHFCRGGTGVRSLADTYILTQRFRGKLNGTYMRAALREFGLTEFERNNRRLAQHLFTGQALTPEEEELLRYYICSGTYGTYQQHVENNVQRGGSGSKAKYVFRRIFPPMEWIELHEPFFASHKALIPVLWVIRPIRGLAKNRKQLLAEWKALLKIS